MTIQSLSNVDFSNAVSVAVAKKTLDSAKFEGQAMVRMIQDAARTQPGGSRPGSEASLGRGTRLDTYA